MYKVLVTGSGGYIGRHVVKALLDMGHRVLAMDINNDLVDDRAEKINASIFEFSPNVFQHTELPDVCVHLAWRNGFVHNAPTHVGDLSAHFQFLIDIMDLGVKKIAVMGSMHEVGYWEGEVDEYTPCNPSSQYGISKNALRQSMQLLTAEKGVDLYWLRAYYIVGDDSKNHSVFTKLLQAAKNGQSTFPFTSGKNLYDFIDVEELAFRIAAAVTQDEITGIINVCTGNAVSLADQAEAFIEKNDLNIKLEFGAFPDRAYDSPGIWGNPDKINRILKNRKDYQ